MTDFACPSCRASVASDASACSQCDAVFGEAPAWKPVPRYALGPPPEEMTWGDFLLFPVKVLLSAVCLFFAFAVLLGEPWHWGRPLAALFFLVLTMAIWVMLFSPQVRAVLFGFLLVGFGLALLYGALLSDRPSMAYPMECSGRRVLGCYMLNGLHALGGTTLVDAFWALMGVLSLVAGAYHLCGKSVRR